MDIARGHSAQEAGMGCPSGVNRMLKVGRLAFPMRGLGVLGGHPGWLSALGTVFKCSERRDPTEDVGRWVFAHLVAGGVSFGHHYLAQLGTAGEVKENMRWRLAEGNTSRLSGG